MKPMLYVQMIAVAVLLAVGQSLFRYGAVRAPLVSGWRTLLGLMLRGPIVLAVCIYGGATVLWVYTLQSVPLSRAYPFVALGFLLVPLAGVIFLGEKLSGPYLFGIVFIVAGLYLTALR